MSDKRPNYTPLPDFEGLTEFDRAHCKVYKKLSPTGKIIQQLERQQNGSYKDVTRRARKEQIEQEEQEKAEGRTPKRWEGIF